MLKQSCHSHAPKGFVRAILSVRLTCEICYYSNFFIDMTAKGLIKIEYSSSLKIFLTNTRKETKVFISLTIQSTR